MSAKTITQSPADLSKLDGVDQKKVLYVSARHVTKNDVNNRHLKLLEDSGNPVFNLHARLLCSNPMVNIRPALKSFYLTESLKTKNSDMYKGPNLLLQICIGSRVMLTHNSSTCDGLFNGAMGRVVGILYPESEQTHVDPSQTDHMQALIADDILPIGEFLLSFFCVCVCELVY